MASADNNKKAVLEVLDPVAAVAERDVRPAPRIRDLNGCKIGLYWNTKPGGNVGLEEVARLLEEKYRGLSFEKHYYRYPAGKSVLDNVAASGCDAIIGATAD